MTNPTNEHREQARALPPDISHEDSERLNGFVRMTSVEIKAVGGVGAATSLEMIGYMRELEHALSSRDAEKWQPISTAPKDGTAVLGYFGNTAGDEPPDMGVTRYDGHKWISTEVPFDEYDTPTHWQSLPGPPTLRSEKSLI